MYEHYGNNPRLFGEAYWAERRRQDNERRLKSRAISIVNRRGIKQQTLKCGCTWDVVLRAHGDDWTEALEFWNEVRKWEYDHPHQPHHEHYEPIQPSAHYPSAPAYYVQPHQVYYVQPPAPGGYSVQSHTPYAQSNHTPASNPPPHVPLDDVIDPGMRADLNREERIDRVVRWAEHHIAQEAWDDGMRKPD